MRLVIYEGVKYRLSERNWGKLLNRFDANNANLSILGYCIIHVGSICEGHSYKCIRCSLGDSYKKTNGCLYLWKRIIGEKLFPYVHLFDAAITWDPKCDSEARQALQKVRDVLSTATRIS